MVRILSMVGHARLLRAAPEHSMLAGVSSKPGFPLGCPRPSTRVRCCVSLPGYCNRDTKWHHCLEQIYKARKYKMLYFYKT
jgi:hypothetical protein